ncbi:hypothetical protein [Flavobacterium chungangense]|uniref:Uncharacterized protein n=1 Tax=Flavobacterium chungangense TaxID=554283 RepID=A0A6V6YZE6_9FLAO|nr:hypothetical protein [Flavobacterium chungangense]CAD0004918.1 hypothetical protein FLACHUCJ7_02138 [Flavobacterium chungangense]
MIFELKLFLTDLFFAFSIFTLLFFIVSIFSKKAFLKNLDEEVSRFIVFTGIIYAVLLVVEIFINLNSSDQEGRFSYYELIFGKYWVTFWIEPLVWILMTQLLRFKKIRRNVFLRLLFSFIFILTIENIISFYSLFNRDYLPSSWRIKSSLFIYPSNIFLEILMKVFILLVLVGIFYTIDWKIKDWKISKIKSQ